MNTKQIIHEVEKEFDEKFTCGGITGTVAFRKGKDRPYEIKKFIHSYTRKLIESVAEEMKYIVALHRLSAWSPQDKDLELISKGSKTTADAITDDIDLKVKEIINQISK